MFNKNQAGLALGSLFALMHFVWIIFLWLGAGEWLINATYNINFIAKEVELINVSFGIAIWGVILAFISGYVTAWLFAAFWNQFSKK